ncbi:hypothetical protein KAJ87_02355, partial [Candidatus Pacearchaeota archaeon]|nr:hypothetical protein [Candidatus Pacearchaeota archaeon]
MDNIKESFNRVKEDMETLNDNTLVLKQELGLFKEELEEIKSLLRKTDVKTKIVENKISQEKELKLNSEVVLLLKKILENQKNTLDRQTDTSTNKKEFSAIKENIQTEKELFSPLKPKNEHISTGNGGVQTDRQTDQ